jgi:hypothetical protein
MDLSELDIYLVVYTLLCGKRLLTYVGYNTYMCTTHGKNILIHVTLLWGTAVDALPLKK